MTSSDAETDLKPIIIIIMMMIVNKLDHVHVYSVRLSQTVFRGTLIS